MDIEQQPQQSAAEGSATGGSRYQNDFEELALLGRGGFGFVTKCRSRISPECVYAIKCIKLGRQCDSIEFMLREASNLARLHHKNVVRYFTAWLEKDLGDSGAGGGNGGGGNSISGGSVMKSRLAAPGESWRPSEARWSRRSPSPEPSGGGGRLNIDSFWKAGGRRGGSGADASVVSNAQCSSTGSEAVGFAASSAADDDDESSNLFAVSVDDEDPQNDSSCSSCVVSFNVSSIIPKPDPVVSDTTLSIPEIAAIHRRVNQSRANSSGLGTRLETSSLKTAESKRWLNASETERNKLTEEMTYEGNKLYIVMEYVEGCVLRKLILDRLCDDPNTAWDLFRQILDGLAYMHKNNLLHRDVKPENIFLKTINTPASRYQVKIGDLGLSKSLDTPGPRFDSGIGKTGGGTHQSLSSNVGTHFYIAPEVEAGARYNQAADVYALGVVLYEMFHAPFETTMERFKELTKLQQTRTVEGIADPNAVLLINQMLNPDPEERPTVSDLIEKCMSRVATTDLQPIIDNLLNRPYSYEMLKILATLFNRKETAPVDVPIPVESPASAKVRFHIHKTMRAFNAFYYEPPAIIPYNERCIGWFQRAHRFIDTSGSSLQPPSCFAAIIKDTLPAVQNATVVRRYALNYVYGATGDVTISASKRLHAAFDVVVNIQKLMSTARNDSRSELSANAPEDDDDSITNVIRDSLLEMEPINVGLQCFQPFVHIPDDLRVACFYGRLLPLLVHFLMDITVASSMTVIKALAEDPREAVLVLKEVQNAEFDRQYSFGDLEERVKQVEKLARFEGTAGELRAMCLELVGNLLPTSDLDPAVEELNYILGKLAYWDERRSVRAEEEETNRASTVTRFRVYLPHSTTLLKSKSEFGFVFYAPTTNGAFGTDPIDEQITAPGTTYAFGGCVSHNALTSFFIELDLHPVVKSLSVAGGPTARRKQVKLARTSAVSVIGNNALNLTAPPTVGAMVVSPSPSNGVSSGVGGVVDVIVSEESLLSEAYCVRRWLLSRDVACVVWSRYEGEFARAKKASSGAWLLYITYRGTKTQQISYKLKDRVGAEKWYSCREGALEALMLECEVSF